MKLTKTEQMILCQMNSKYNEIACVSVASVCKRDCNAALSLAEKGLVRIVRRQYENYYTYTVYPIQPSKK